MQRLIERQQRAAAFVPGTFDAAARTVEVVWTSGATVRRFDWFNGVDYDERLLVADEAVDLARLNSGRAPVLDTHRDGSLSQQFGSVVRAWIANGEGRAQLRLSSREDVAGIVADIGDGVISNISVGYSVRKYRVTEAVHRDDGGQVDLWEAVDWEPWELSFVPVPADAAAGTRNHHPTQALPCEFVRAHPPVNLESTMKRDKSEGDQGVTDPVDPAPAAPAVPAATETVETIDARAASITELCVRHGVETMAGALIRNGASLDAARAAVLDELARRDLAAGGHQNTVRVHKVRDETETRMAGLEQAIMHRLSPRVELDDNGRQWRGMSLLEIGRDLLERAGVRTRGMPVMELAKLIMHHRAGYQTTSDFSHLMSGVASKRLRNAYDENPGTYTAWARRAPNAPDFKAMKVVQLSGAPELLQVNEHGEFTYGTLTDGSESYQLVTYGRIVALSRQAIINDDLRGFDRLVTAFGFSARRLENRLVYSQITSNPIMSDDASLFDSSHNNVPESALTLDGSGLGAARAGMRMQTGLQGEPLNIVPRFLLVPAALEQAAYQYTSANFVPAEAANINEFRAGGRTALEPVVEPLLDSADVARWFLAAASSQVDTVEFCYLDGAEGAVIESEPGFEVDGVSWKCRLDFAAKAADWRGLYASKPFLG